MIANYGYKDGEGEFFITVNQDKCAACGDKPCIPACPESLFLEEEDPYGESVAVVDDQKRRKLKYECAACKPSMQRPPLPCVSACPFDAVEHSW
jgi:Fe-S-cluster-containing hydrogenase component 2